MRLWPELATRVSILSLVALFGWSALAQLADGVQPPGPLAAVVAFPAFLVLSFAWMSRRYWRRVVPAFDEEFPEVGRARIAPGGSFEWHPRGEPRIGVRHGLVHSWWDAERGPRAFASVGFEVPDAVPAPLLRAATAAGLTAARRALPGRGKVRAKAAARDKEGPMGIVRVRLEVRGVGADAAWARAAAEGFARAFLAHLARREHAAERVA